MSFPWSLDGRLVKAVKKGDLYTVKKHLLNGANANATDMAGRSVLSFAVAINRTDITELLIQNGANTNITYSFGAPPPLISAETPEMVGLLLRNGANPNVKTDENKMTALFVAANEGDLEIVKILLKHGADPNIADIQGRTPLGIAEYRGYVEVSTYLRSNGATH